MIEVLLTLVPSVLWLLYRCFKLFQVPVDEIINDLNIDIPHIANICVDAITSNSIIVHWDIQLRLDENLCYILLVNNKEVSTISSTSCKLSDLDPNVLYKIQIIAVNLNTNYRSISDSVYVETLSSDANPLEVIKQVHNNNFKHQPQEEVNIDDCTDDLAKVTKDISPDSIHNIKDPGILSSCLRYYQLQLAKLCNEFRSMEENISVELDKLKQDNRKLLEDLKFQNQTINKHSSILKENQKKKEELLLQKTKLNSKLMETKKSINNKSKNLHSMKLDLEKLYHKKQFIEANGDNEKHKLRQSIQLIESEIETLKGKQTLVEENLKLVKNRRKQINKLHNIIHELSIKFNETCFNKDHSLNEKGLEILNEVCVIKPEWANFIESEKNNLNDFDQAFKSALVSGLKSYVTLYNGLETYRSANEKNYSPSWMSEINAAAKFGCQNYHPGKFYKNRNRSNSRGFRNISNGTANSNSSSKATSPGPPSGLSMTGINSSSMTNVANHLYQDHATGINTNLNPNVVNSMNNYYGDIYAEEEDILSPPNYDSINMNSSLNSPVMTSANMYLTPRIDSPNLSNSNLNIPMNNWVGMSGLNSPNMQSQQNFQQQSQQPHAQPISNSLSAPPQQLNMNNGEHVEGQMEGVNFLNHQNLSSSSLGSSRFSSKFWNGNSLNHTRSISGSNIWVNNGFSSNTLETNDFRPFEQSQLFGPGNLNLPNPVFMDNSFPLSPATNSPPNLGFLSPMGQLPNSMNHTNQLNLNQLSLNEVNNQFNAAAPIDTTTEHDKQELQTGYN